MKKLILVLALALTACGTVKGGPGVVPINVTKEGITYELFYVQGMPCMRFGRGIDGNVWSYDGVSCDWSKWNGASK